MHARRDNGLYGGAWRKWDAPDDSLCDHGSVMVNYSPAWDDPTSAWWVKVNRARTHISDLARLVNAYKKSEPYSLSAEPTSDPDRTAYRLRLKSVPIEISATVGDVLSNLRAALECLAYEIARLGLGGTFADEKQERVPTFPIFATPKEFDEYFAGRRISPLYDSRARTAFRSVQPFVVPEMIDQLGVEMGVTYDVYFINSNLHRLDRLWNVDKHRRLNVVAWRPDVIWWGSNGPTKRQLLPGDGTMADGSILFYVAGADEGYGTEIQHEFELVLTDDPAFSESLGQVQDVVELLDQFHEFIIHELFPKVFTYMSQSVSSN